MLKKILAVLFLLVALVAVVGLLLPRTAHVQRSVVIARPASLVFATVNSFQLFPRWSPWQDLDPNMHQTMEGPRDGVGAKLVWSGNAKVGSGTQLITAVVPDQSVASDLDFSGMGVAKSVLTLTPEGKSTRASWTLAIDMGANPIGHYVGLTMDRMIGKDFALGLDRLKALVETMPDVDISGFSAEPVDLLAGPVLLVAESAAPDAMAQAYTDGFSQIGRFMTKNKLHQAGPPFSIDGMVTSTRYSFDAGIPVDRGDATSADGVRTAQSYAGKALKATHVGAYDGLPISYDQLAAFIAAHGYSRNGATFASFVDDPGNTPTEKLRTEIFAPIQ